jgi:hypothetical protein
LGEGPIASSLWAIHCSSDVASELESGRLTWCVVLLSFS